MYFVLVALKMGKGEGGDWNHGTFGCLSDMSNCKIHLNKKSIYLIKHSLSNIIMISLGCCGYCCLPCQMGKNADRLGESSFLYCILTCCIPCVPIFLLRGKARERYGIDGGTGEDALCSFCCGACVSCQIANELDERGA